MSCLRWSRDISRHRERGANLIFKIVWVPCACEAGFLLVCLLSVRRCVVFCHFSCYEVFMVVFFSACITLFVWGLGFASLYAGIFFCCVAAVWMDTVTDATRNWTVVWVRCLHQWAVISAYTATDAPTIIYVCLFAVSTHAVDCMETPLTKLCNS